MFDWLNKGLDYKPPRRRAVMPTGKLLKYSQQHWAPYACHMLIISVIATITGPYIAYPIAVVLTGALLIYYWKKNKYPELKTTKEVPIGDWLLAIFIGVLGIALWILPYHFFPEIMFKRIPILGNKNIYLSFTYGTKIIDGHPEATYMPFKDIASRHWRIIFIAFRIFGAAVLVPFWEELFVRSAISRFVIDEHYQNVPIGYYTKKSFLITLAIYTVSHPWWLVAVIWGGLTFWLYYYKKNLQLVIAAHAVSNLLLAVYVLTTGNYYLW